MSAEDFEPAVPEAGQLASIKTVVDRALELQRNIETTDDYLKELRGELHTITTRTLPDIMASAGTSEFKSDDGTKVTIKDFVSGSLPKEEDARAAAFIWLESVEAGDLIKNTLRFDFDRGEDNMASEIKAKADELGIAFDAKRDVHPQTLAAFARERMREGLPIELERIGLVAGRAAKITPPKEKKK